MNLPACFVAAALAASSPAPPQPPLDEPLVAPGGVARPAMQWWPAAADGARPPGTKVDAIVLHHTVIDGPAAVTAAFFARPETQVSAHFVVGKDGTIIQGVRLARRANHAGVSSFGGRDGVNAFSIGIEIVNVGDGVDPYPDAQYDALARLMPYLMATYGIGWDRVTSHKSIARPAGRKPDPSPNFDFGRLYDEAQRVAPQPGRLAPEIRRNAFPALPPIADRGKRIAIVGAGAAGLTAAFELTRLGFRAVTLYAHGEARPVGGNAIADLKRAIGLPPGWPAVWASPETGPDFEALVDRAHQDPAAAAALDASYDGALFAPGEPSRPGDAAAHLARWLAGRGVTVVPGLPVRALRRPAEGHWGEPRPVQVVTDAGTTEHDAVIVAALPTAEHAFLPDASPLERRMLDPIRLGPDARPFYDAATLRADRGRYLAQILDLQGERNTLFATTNLAGGSEDQAAAYARRLVRRFFR